uniref:Bifunctional L-3-cyanoalanine synthase/cysteine synthase D1-like isoform X1 n=1 Tax=Rhizophora mucronata TaxID=61149 RepID=A0A2P2ILW8_RHIMU
MKFMSTQAMCPATRLKTRPVDLSKVRWIQISHWTNSNSVH